ncbi:hypothetical protein [Klebsiella pneumoniae]|uniref:hypothetical protein n=1 Tax=Klebsiella pneumoniae TaxID=573 RepID=UPI0039DF4616
MRSKQMAANFCTIELTLHKIVRDHSNHGYVHPNETDSEPCQPAGFCFSGGSDAAAIFFSNPGMTTQQLEDWLGQQKIYLAHFNRLIAEKPLSEERLSQISAEIGRVATGSFEGMLSFPWDPSPLVENPQQDSGQSAD